MKIDRQRYLQDVIGKISMMSKTYVKRDFNPLDSDDMGDNFTWVNFDRQIIQSEIYYYLIEHIDFLKNLNEEKLKNEIKNLIYKGFSYSKNDLKLRELSEYIFLLNANNETIRKDTDNFIIDEIEFLPEKLQMVIESALNSSKTVDDEKSNSFLLDHIDLPLYQALISHPDLICSLNWRVFEKLLEDILKMFKYEVELMQGTKDNGIDIIAIKKEDNLGIHRYLIQAKRWNNKVGIEPVERLLFKVKETNSTKGCLVTTSQFTRGAWLMANQYKYMLDLKDYENLKLWINRASIIKTRFNDMQLF